MRRRELIASFATAICGWSSAGRAQRDLPEIGFPSGESPPRFASFLPLSRQGLNEAGFVEGKNVAIEYRWAEGQNERLTSLAADLVRRQVAVILAPGSTPAALAAKGATAT